MKKLSEVISDIHVLDDELTIYARPEWTGSSFALVEREPHEGGVPPEAVAQGMTYFLEVSIAKEFINDLLAVGGRTTDEIVNRLIYYAKYDA
jgi:hypothetical protein